MQPDVFKIESLGDQLCSDHNIRFLFQKIVINRFRKLDGVIAVSQATADECLKRGFDPDKVFVVRNGVDIDLAEIDKKESFRPVLEEKLGIPLEGKKFLAEEHSSSLFRACLHPGTARTYPGDSGQGHSSQVCRSGLQKSVRTMRPSWSTA